MVELYLFVVYEISIVKYDKSNSLLMFSHENKKSTNTNKNKDLNSITSSIRGGPINNKNINLTSKNNSKFKHKKMISNYI